MYNYFFTFLDGLSPNGWPQVALSKLQIFIFGLTQRHKGNAEKLKSGQGHMKSKLTLEFLEIFQKSREK